MLGGLSCAGNSGYYPVYPAPANPTFMFERIHQDNEVIGRFMTESDYLKLTAYVLELWKVINKYECTALINQGKDCE